MVTCSVGLYCREYRNGQRGLETHDVAERFPTVGRIGGVELLHPLRAARSDHFSYQFSRHFRELAWRAWGVATSPDASCPLASPPTLAVELPSDFSVTPYPRASELSPFLKNVLPQTLAPQPPFTSKIVPAFVYTHRVTRTCASFSFSRTPV